MTDGRIHRLLADQKEAKALKARLAAEQREPRRIGEWILWAVCWGMVLVICAGFGTVLGVLVLAAQHKTR